MTAGIGSSLREDELPVSELKSCFMTCPKGLEGLLLDELRSFGVSSCRETVAGVAFDADLTHLYRVALWSRLGNRLLLVLGRGTVETADELYEAVQAISWHEHFDSEVTFAVDFSGTSRSIVHTGFAAQKVKDAVVDCFRDHDLPRPSVDRAEPDIRINARLAKGQLTLALDLSGESLHRRHYREQTVPAPLKENLAAALLLRAGWLDDAGRAACEVLLDPMCGSGTLLIEAALMAADIAPAIRRERFGFHSWSGHDESLWQTVRAEAEERRREGLKRPLPRLFGSDEHPAAIAATRRHAENAGVAAMISLEQKPVAALTCPPNATQGLLITNPPYGERLGEIETLGFLYQELAEVARRELPGWRMAVFTGNPDLVSALRLRADKRYRLHNGLIPSQLLLFQLRTEAARQAAVERPPQPLSEGAQMLLNRLRKNQRRLERWLATAGTDSYRLYDADLPEYAVAIDRYGSAVHVQEYQPPRTISDHVARQRMSEVRRALQELWPECAGQMFFKQRRRQKGLDQYQPLRAGGQSGSSVFQVMEGEARFEVNLSDYLDTGLFLDHRPLRRIIHGCADGKRVLNLFCYTAAITVQAALGGAQSSLSIDMSNTYLDWAKRNLDLNGLQVTQHRLLRADCLTWLETAPQEFAPSFDLIVCDPPTFSNSKKMEGVLDVQRDHVELIEQCMALLVPGGELYFSNNFRRFRMDDSIRERYRVEDITAATIDEDFSRNPRIHNCWRIQHRQ